MTRADHCPIGGQPCQSLCDTPCTTAMREHNPDHPYVRKMVGCGHGRLFSEPCNECEIVALKEEYRRAVRTVQRVRALLDLYEELLEHITPAHHESAQREVKRRISVGDVFEETES